VVDDNASLDVQKSRGKNDATGSKKKDE